MCWLLLAYRFCPCIVQPLSPRLKAKILGFAQIPKCLSRSTKLPPKTRFYHGFLNAEIKIKDLLTDPKALHIQTEMIASARLYKPSWASDEALNRNVLISGLDQTFNGNHPPRRQWGTFQKCEKAGERMLFFLGAGQKHGVFLLCLLPPPFSFPATSRSLRAPSRIPIAARPSSSFARTTHECLRHLQSLECPRRLRPRKLART